MTETRGIVLEGFAGPGGASEGMRVLGLDPIGVEWDEAACATRRAAGHRTIRADVASLPLDHLAEEVGGVWLLPPCPTFSAAGKGEGRDEMPFLLSFLERVYRLGKWHDPLAWHEWSDARTPLILEPVRWALTLNPEWMVCEQVPAGLPIWESVAAILEDHGYSCWAGVLNTADLGVPQTRLRALLLCSRTRKVHPPHPTHAEKPEPSLFGADLAPWVSMAEALGQDGFTMEYQRGEGMTERHGERPGRDASEPAFTVTGGAGGAGGGAKMRLRMGAQANATEGTIDEPAPTITASCDNGDSRWLVDRRTVSRGPGGTKVPTALVGSDRPAPALAQAEKWTLTRPATTVCADPRLADPGHRDREGGVAQFATDCVKLTERDGSILQGFRPDYPWQGNKSKRWQQIGNAVPPPLATACVSAVMA